MLSDAATVQIELPKALQFEPRALALAPLPASLPRDVESLHAMLHAQRQACEQAHQQALLDVQQQATRHLQYLYEQMALMRQRMFGRSSEVSADQHRLFDEAEVLAAQDEAAERDEPVDAGNSSAPAKKPRGHRAALPAHLPRVEIIHDVPQSERLCACGTPMVLIGQQISEQLDIVPMKVQVLRHIRNRYGCPNGSEAHRQAPITAALPAQPLPKSNASASLLAMLTTVKFVDGLPLYRFEKVMARHEVILPRQTQARWVIGVSGLLQPLCNLARDTLYEGPVVHIDETLVQVLKEPGRAASANSYMWVQTGGPPGRPVVLYDYDPSRGGQVPLRLLAGYRGYVMSDGYEGYNGLAATPGVKHLVCMAHARRKFVEAQRVQAKGKRGRADEAIESIKALYRIEREGKQLSDAQRYALRQEKSVPALKTLKQWLDKTLLAVPPAGALGKALAYLAKYWPKMSRYTERGDLPIDNNRCENAIRPFVVGRKAWLFNVTPAGANASALIYSMIETAKANGVEPYRWLSHVLAKLPAAKTADDYEALMPWNMKLTD